VDRRKFLTAAPLLLTSCGYRVAGHSDLLPRSLHSIAIPPFENLTTRYTLSDRLPQAISREFISRTRYRIVTERNEADAVLQGAVVNVMTWPNVSDPVSGRSTGVQISVYLQVVLKERETGKVLFSRPNMEFRQRYEIAVDQSAYFEESDLALQRLSEDVARTVVSSVLEAF
jgi:hypothetical protein